MNKENKILFSIIILISIITIVFLYFGKKNTALEDANKLVDLVRKSKNYQLLYIGSDECEACSYEEPQIEALIKTYNFGMYYINLKNISNNNVSKIINKLGMHKKEFNTPSLIVFKDGKYQNDLAGLNSVDSIFAFLQNNSIISNEEKMYVNYLDLDSYKELISSDEEQILALGSFTNNESNESQVILWNIAKKYNIKINYLMLSNLSSKEGKEFESSLDYFNNNEVGIPMILIVKNNKVIKVSLENLDEEGYIKFFKENNLM